MGYILPINHDQYTQYANRTTATRQTALTVSPVYRATLDTKLLNYGQNNLERHKPVEFLYDKTKVKKSKKFNEILSELTGKGYKINESI
ncbi:hypothetical protein [Bacillus marinisedimentorum]|uniref:hypothetical protein n=1 Tax=Bacillus marinisedimentorum TaxID=1821260 RepID=UPI0008724D05|nr:hypothetical protein [Bacillus marinisedimentorum]